MEKIKVKIHPTFIVFACLLIYFGQSVLFFNYLIVMFVHEFAHAFVAKRLGYNIKNIKLIPFGISLNMNADNLMPKDEIKIALAGPIVNLFLSLVTISIWWLFPESYNYSYIFCYANFVTAIFNLIPAFPLDGGRVLLSLLKQKYSLKNSIKFCKIINVVISVLLLFLFVWSCFISINFTYLFVIFCVLSGVLDNNKMQNYTLINYGVLKKIGRVVKLKQIVISQNEPLYRVCKYIDNFSYLSISVLNEDKNIIFVFTESDFLKLFEKYNASTPFKYVVKMQKYA